MPKNAHAAATHEVLEARIRAMLPPIYQQSFRDIAPLSMGSASLKFGSDGRVAWAEMWGSFCDLAMAGGPPHRGTLLEPARAEEVAQQPDLYAGVAAEICRGLHLVTGLHAYPAASPGWVSVDCPSATMSAWLVRAITMENISARAGGLVLHLPAGPAFRVEKEIKNVITSVAKTTHYWLEHISQEQQDGIGDLLRTMQSETPLIEPGYAATLSPGDQELLGDRLATLILESIGLRSSLRRCGRWLGLGCDDVGVAISMMRLLIVCNVLARREGTVVFVPVNPLLDPQGATTATLVATAYRMAREVK